MRSLSGKFPEHMNQDADFTQKWEQYFSKTDLTEWELKKGLNALYGYDLVPQPSIVAAAVKAAHRLQNVAVAIYILEMVRHKSVGNQEIYNYIMDQIRPTLDELGFGGLP